LDGSTNSSSTSIAIHSVTSATIKLAKNGPTKYIQYQSSITAEQLSPAIQAIIDGPNVRAGLTPKIEKKVKQTNKESESQEGNTPTANLTSYSQQRRVVTKDGNILTTSSKWDQT
jgi:hypothetical protein